MENLVFIQKLNPLDAEITSPICLKVMNNDKGRSIFLNSLQSVKTAAILEFIPNAGIRGNHYHLNKSETMYIIEGKMKLFYWLPHQPEIREMIVESGDLITIKPNLGHAYKAIERTLGFETGTHPYDPADTVYDYRIKEDVHY